MLHSTRHVRLTLHRPAWPAADTYNGMLGLHEACTECPTPVGPGTYTTYAAAQQCDVERVDLVCDSDKSKSFAYDKASQLCQLCPAGTWRDYDNSLECTPCPAGTYSAEGDAECSPCPIGEYNPSEGLADQTEITGFKCVKCAVGSMPLTTGSAGVDAVPTEGSTYCDAW